MDRHLIIKRIIGAILFLLLLSILLTVLGLAFLPQEHGVDRQQHAYYHFPEKTIDVLCDGNSTLRQGFSPNVVWHDYGIVAYSRVEGRQCPEMTYFEVKDTLNSHDLKVVMMGVPRLFKEYDYVANEPMLRRCMDYKHMDFEKIKIAAAISSRTDIKQIVSYFFPLIRYHSRWTTVKYEEAKMAFDTNRDIWRGQLRVRICNKYKPKVFSDTSREIPDYNEDAIKWYKKTIDLCKENNIKVLIVSMPELTNTRGIHEGIQNFADSCGVDYLDFNTDELVEETGLRFDEDFHNKHHLNLTGARKIAKYLGAYMVENYNVPQWECSDETKKMLDADYDAYMDEYKRGVKMLRDQASEQNDDTE